MLIDTNDVVNAKEIHIKIVLKNGEEQEFVLLGKDIKSIDLKLVLKEYRKSIWEETDK